MKKSTAHAFKKLKRRIRQPFEILGVNLMLFLVNVLPVGMALRLGGGLGRLAYTLLRRRRRAAHINLEIAFPDKTPAERASIARRSFANMGRIFVEVLRIPKMDRAYFSKYVELVNPENLDRPLEKGRGLISVVGHFGNWELQGAFIPVKGYPLDVVVAEQKNRRVDALINKIRRHHGAGIIYAEEAPKKVLRALKQNRIVAIVGDQDARRGAGVEVEFFGRATSFHQGAALFSLKTGAAIQFCLPIRTGTGPYHRVVILRHYDFTPTEDRKADIRNLTQLHASALEAWIREYPENYLWAHKRWKSMGVDYG